ncbi:MAG: hypothetical protein HFJ25_01425 [Clostridia bacterium]|jgi:hypothetical protein|nr:hypothetical protein [Clostridia bacterium]
MIKHIDNVIEQIKHYASVTTNENRFVVAQDIIDRLFISNYFSVDDMANFIKNELASIFSLSSIETELLLQEYEGKQKIMHDKLEIVKLKESLEDIPVYQEPIKCLNFPQVQKIVQYIINNEIIYNKQLFIDFVLNDLSNHFELDEEEKKELQEVIADDKF